MIKRIAYFLLTAWLISGCSDSKETEKSNTDKKLSPYEYVNPFIGTGGHGHTYPGASLPFGMMQLSPDTRLEGWDGCGGYHYSDGKIYGFTHTHLSGTGVPDYCDILLLPMTGKYNPAVKPASGFKHESEKASPGYYKVFLDDYKVETELTVSRRSGIHKYDFKGKTNPEILIDLAHRDKVTGSSLTIVSRDEISGMRRSQAWANDQVIYFVAKFSSPIKTAEIYSDGKISDVMDSVSGLDLKALLTFENVKGPVLVKIGISAVSVEGARKNLETEIPGWDFEKTRNMAVKEWTDELNKIVVEGGTDKQKTAFYTAVYHAYLNPNTFMDVDGSYRGRDLKNHQSDEFTNHTVFSLWDTYRATHPLFTITQQKRTVDFINTFIKQYEQGGLLPVWELAGNETYCMIGYHAIPVIVDAYMKGIRGFDAEKAFEAMVKSSEQDHFGLSNYKKYGYISASDESESVSKTLEYAYDDWCIALMAKELGKEAEYKKYMMRAQSYKNVFDPASKFMVAKMNQSWFTPFDPKEVNFNYTEANSWQYSFYVPQDISGLIELHGGKQNLAKTLDRMFSEKSETTGREQSDITGLIGQYAHGNEPSHHMAYLFNYINQPWKTQKIVKQIMNDLYTDKPDGLCGNEDCGQMSSWLVFSAMGFYPVVPGSDYYVIGSPLFDKATISLENGKQFVVVADGLSDDNIYIQSAMLNGKKYSHSYISHKDIVDGGTLTLIMGNSPSKSFGVKDEDVPVSSITDFLIQPVPFVTKGKRTFMDTTSIELGVLNKDAIIYYTTDGSVPTEKSKVYEKPFIIEKTTILKAFAASPGKENGMYITAEFNKIPLGRTIKLYSKYASQYSAGGDLALIDFIKGMNNYRTGAWQGYEGIDMEALVDLGSIQPFKEISVGFIQDPGAWIFFPQTVIIMISPDGSKFEPAKTFTYNLEKNNWTTEVKNFTVGNPYNKKTRFVKVVAKNMGPCPDWHPGSGGKSWIFCDEISIK
ncbi:MAG: hypothetical protein A2W91_17495 [Bacteroidetes bacterium GWF2_38_335]|nr:MAG: hypothetical protein A2W91_17495 [Bacteroidetes bacterium GWF2_38_335]OFY78071.1 MAG: hypothetical protein A2281_18960 [Bacteroidetes bacterium RIFOXYA12_FULL_38_20]HBS88344.1 glycosyl hydrolase family 92 [Bacteroidales bacterium]